MSKKLPNTMRILEVGTMPISELSVNNKCNLKIHSSNTVVFPKEIVCS